MSSQMQIAANPAAVIEGTKHTGELAHDYHSALIGDSIGYLASKVVPGFFGLISVPVLVRLIGINEYGRLSVLLPILLALSGAGSGWLQQGILRFHPGVDESGHTPPVFNRAVLRGTTYSVLVLAAGMLPVLTLLRYGATMWLIAGFYCAVIVPYLVWLSLLQAQLHPRAVIRNEAVRSCAGFCLPVLLILLTGNRSTSIVLLGLVLGYLLPLVVNSRTLMAMLATGTVGYGDEATKSVLTQLWRFGWAVGIWLMLCQILPVIGRSAIQQHCGYAQAGIYASLYEVAVRCFSLFASPVMQAAHPRIMRYWNRGDYASARHTIRRAVEIQALIFMPVEVVGMLFSKPITRIILGPQTNVPGALLPLLMLGGFLWQIALFAHKPLEIMQRSTVMLLGMGMVLVIEFAGNFLAVPRFGVTAAVFIFVIGACAYIVFVLYRSGPSFFRLAGMGSDVD